MKLDGATNGIGLPLASFEAQPVSANKLLGEGQLVMVCCQSKPGNGALPPAAAVVMKPQTFAAAASV